MKQPWLLFALIAVSGGCSMGPDYQRPPLEVEIPAEWAGTDPAMTPAVQADPADHDGRWWEAFQDPDLNLAVDRALLHNNGLAAAAGRILEARAQAGAAESQRWPTLEIGASASRSKSANLSAPGFFSPYLTSYSASGTSRWEADLWGRLSRGEEAAVANVLASENERRALVQSLIAEVVRTHLEIAELRLQLDLTRETISSYESTRLTVEDRYRAGLVPALDLHLARQNLASAEAQQPVLAQALAAARRRLEILCGQYPAGKAEDWGPLAADPDLPPVPQALPSILLERRPDLVSAEMRLHAATAQIGQAKAALYPRISLTGSAGTTSRELADLGTQGSDVWSLVGNLVMPLLNRGATTAQIKAAEARTLQAVSAYRQEVLQAFAEVENALDRDHFQQQRLAHLTVAFASAREAAQLSEDRYRRGLDSILVLLESQRRDFTTHSQLLTTRRERRAARVDLILALGGSWDLVQDGSSAAGSNNPDLNQGVQQ